MSNEQKEALLQRYKDMSTDELFDIYRKGTLTEVASQAIKEVLNERAISTDEIEIISQELDVTEYGHLASLGNRFFAQVLDVLIALLIGVVFYIPVYSRPDIDWIFVAIGYFSYYLLSDGLHGGQSLGKRVFNIAVVIKNKGGPCTYIRSFVRNISLLILGFFDAIFILGSSRRRLGDFIAGTEVVNVLSKSKTKNT